MEEVSRKTKGLIFINEGRLYKSEYERRLSFVLMGT